MTVFVWEQLRQDYGALSRNARSTAWAAPTPRCVFCDEHFADGQRVWHWHVDGGNRDIRAHAECVARSARGMIKDIGECLR